jgi:uncharacterized protein YdcH (DUF465 family)
MAGSEDMHTESRLRSIEASLHILTEQVTRMAGLMERLAVIEERNQRLEDRIASAVASSREANEQTVERFKEFRSFNKEEIHDLKVRLETACRELIDARMAIQKIMIWGGMGAAFLAFVIEPAVLWAIGKLF